MEINVKPLATIKNARTGVSDDYWGDVVSEITLVPEMPDEAFDNIELFSHLEIIFYFNNLEDEPYEFSRKPRGNTAYPTMGILAQRNSNRPNKIGLCIVALVSHAGRTIKVKGLDAINGTPVLDIKPVFKEFLPMGDIKQPDWVGDLMKNYWE